MLCVWMERRHGAVKDVIAAFGVPLSVVTMQQIIAISLNGNTHMYRRTFVGRTSHFKSSPDQLDALAHPA